MRWAAPEQLRNGGTSKEADVYSFAMTMYEVSLGALNATPYSIPFLIPIFRYSATSDLQW